MFRRLSEPLPLSEASLLAFRPALNAPVLNVGFLPVGPARGAVVVFAEEWGGIGVAIGTRASEGGQVVVFRNQQSIEPDVTVAVAMEPALAEAERMGFLFDEDLVASGQPGQGRADAMALWGRLMGEIEIPPPIGAVSQAPVGSDSGTDLSIRLDSGLTGAVESIVELVLEDVAEVEIPEIALESRVPASPPAAIAAPPQQAPPQSVAPPQPLLTKFRHADEAPGESSGIGDESGSVAASGSQLGRIPLVRVRRGTKRVPYLARLLSSF
ncbi:MAG: hypothetical protein GY910_11130 [bacterium]|nr:hypothetical protein [bacterium]